ncbi:MAG: TRAP transporter substrate-binding protein DctP [Treponema sp.]|jgi:TRAP-type C4-dicarboxylate transport system substrate-binding protein|nr:TRAP transporter substrate-binding protein DctP [Treponema sp.]
MKKLWFLLILMIFLAINAVYAQRGSARSEVVNIRVASSLPKNSDWGRALDRLAADWGKATNNQVRAIVNHDGREGTEGDMLRKLNGDAIQVALFTSAAIAEICPEVLNLSVPFMIHNNAELDVVLQNVQPVLESRVKNEFVILAWSKGGWIYVFSKEKVLVPDDLRKQKLGTSPELKDMNTVFRTMGYQLVEADIVNIGTRLASNMVNAIYMIPAAIAPMQMHKSLSHMLDLPIAPIMGALVMNRITWNKLTQDQQREIVNITRRTAVEFDASMARTESNAISAMGRDGLNVNKPNKEQNDAWQLDTKKALPSLVGTIFDRDLYNRINELLEKTRSGR